ncbi:hypothetical protein GCM10023330_00300 [Litoribaculum gwangyangense]|uniref:C1q domain-containing protein n=2 Tax=Litoribaculum gwangyangense TaxID=1130722 RepID=A0ABP9BV16_9FLAO
MVILLFGINYHCYSQVGIGTTSPDPSSILDIESNNGGLLIPRLSSTQIASIPNPANGLLVYNTDLNIFQFNYGSTVTPNWLRTSRKLSVKCSNTDTTTDVNNNAAINAPIMGSLNWNDDISIYNVDTVNNTITINQTGRYRITVNVSLITTVNGARFTPEMWLEINGTQRGTFGSTGYIRINNNHEESSLHITEVFNLNSGDIVSVAIVRTANAGVVTLRTVGSSNIYIEKI